MSKTVHLESGTIIGGVYRVVAPLSEGGMGAVYVAEHLTTKKERALKVMRAELVTSAKMRERFVQEAQVGSRIDSEHVVDVIDAGIDAVSGTPWLAMELLRGATLTRRIDRQGPLEPAVAKELFGQLCHAIGAAHDVGIVHRDLKPDNIFLATSRRTGAGFTLKVLDFGIAKLVSEAGTRSTGAIGTPLFMPPEQMVPGTSITPAADVWALGLIAFYVLTGKAYWHAGNQDASSAMMLLNEVTNLPILKPSERVKELGIDVTLPEGFDAWFVKCVNRVIDYRFASAHDVWFAFEELLGGPDATTRDRAVHSMRKPRSDADAAATERTEFKQDSGTIAAGPLTTERIDPSADTLYADKTKASEPDGPEASKPKGVTDFAVQRTAGTTAAPIAKSRWLLYAVAGVAVVIAVIFVVGRRDPDVPPAQAGSSGVTLVSGKPAGPSSNKTEPAAGASVLDSIVDMAAEGNLQAAHDKLLSLPKDGPERSDPRAAAVTAQWVKDIFKRAGEGGTVVQRRSLLTRVVTDELPDDKLRQEAFDRLYGLEPREPTDKSRHYVIVEAGKKTSATLVPYARAAMVTELAGREDVVVGSSSTSAYDMDRFLADKSLRAVYLQYEVETAYDAEGLKVTVSGTIMSYPDRSLLSNGNVVLSSPGTKSPAVAVERDLSLIAAQRLAAKMLKAKEPAVKPVQPTMPVQTAGPMPTAGPANAPPPPPRPKNTCRCAPGDPLCDCL